VCESQKKYWYWNVRVLLNSSCTETLCVLCVCMYVCVCLCMYACVCLCVCVCVCVVVCVFGAPFLICFGGKFLKESGESAER